MVPVADAVARLKSDARLGLAAAEARRRLQIAGENRIAGESGKSPWAIFWSQLQDFMVLVLLGATAISFFLGETADATAILAIVAVNACLGYVQESRAERSLEALRRLTAPTARVLRDGRPCDLPAERVVPGDVLLLGAGDRVPADARLIAANGAEAEESALTGESAPVGKTTAVIGERRLPPGDRRNMVFQGTHLTRGNARGLVVATGMQTEVGRIAGLIRTAGDPSTPLQRRLDQLGRMLVLACLGISAAVVSGGVLHGEDPYRMFLAGVSLAVAAIPEGLPAIVTIALALGVQRMIKKRAIVRRLPAVETLGCATVVCTDKTGTLTQNRMAVRAAWAAGRTYGPDDAADGPLQRALAAAALCSDAGPDAGDPTEVALVRAALGAGLQPQGRRRGELPFEPERRRMTVVCDDRLIVKGALDELLPRCNRVLARHGEAALDAATAAEVRKAGDAMAGRALRVLAVAEREVPRPGNAGQAPAHRRFGTRAGRESQARPPDDLTPSQIEPLERDLVLLGLFGLIDPPRPEAREAVRRCRAAGVRAVMITGDHALTARAIAEDLGMLADGGHVVTGEELATWSEDDLVQRVERVRVYARVSPADKLRIVRAWRSRGHVVAMTGDGVNDAPAVKEADIGVAMGGSGTDVTKEASAMVLTDDNFATIVAAIEEGRAIYDNIRKFIRYLLSCNTGEILVMLLGTMLGWPLPLLPLQMLLVNLVTDGLPALALGIDPPSADVMNRPPRAPRESLFARGLGRLIAMRGVIIGLCTLFVFAAELRATGDLAQARTLAMCTLVLSQLLHAFDARSETRSIWQLGFFTNPALLAAAASSLAVLLVVLYTPALSALFRATPVDPVGWLLVIGASATGAVVAGIGTLMRARLRRLQHRRHARAA